MLIGRREQWLKQLAQELLPEFDRLGYSLPKTISYTLHIPNELPNGARLTSNELEKTLGLCFFHADTCYIYVHTLCPPANIGAVLAHELCHAALPKNRGHKGSFAKLAGQIGLAGNLIYASAGPALTAKIAAIEKRIGKCPPLCFKAKCFD